MKELVALVVGVYVCVAVLLAAVWLHGGVREATAVEGIEKFSSAEEFATYLEKAESLMLSCGYMRGFFGGVQEEVGMLPEPAPPPKAAEQAGEPSRVSETTVQVKGIDEPDIVKTDGRRIFFSSNGVTRVINAFPPSNLSVKVGLEKGGELLLKDGMLVLFTGNKIYGFDVSRPEAPEERWDVELNGTLAAARLYGGRIYIVTRNWLNREKPAPIYPLAVRGIATRFGEEPLVVPASEIYHPVEIVPVDVVYTAAVLNPQSGEVEKSVSFVGSSSTSVIYMSKNALYITYSYPQPVIKTYSKFLREACSDILPKDVLEKLEDLTSKAEVSSVTSLKELEEISEDLKGLEGEISRRAEEYFAERMRDFETTGVVKIELKDFEIVARGEVPGRPLNQFSLDEYDGYLRIATTVGGWRGLTPRGGETANDVYVLDDELKVVGSLEGLGVSERIYAVRFLGDKGYVVTFKETDPFFVIDLSDPAAPKLCGELKIPGYSSYLHPITEDLILGIGKEDWKVKISLFDVSSLEMPVELDKFVLDEYWSDVLATHHAFLLDEKHGIFFLPCGDGGYVFSYEDGLELVKRVNVEGVRRALYIDDYLYVIADTKLVVLDEQTWERVNEIELEMETFPPYPPKSTA
ncbi:MAG: C-terminal beta-propeller domain-containing protein [Candidatus Alkanophagales archaeon MCA70_species_2]|nr:C-terminal beta-propeller domain-containing protein [Candidatus Alkanophaga liquidiphilum]